MDGMYVVVVVIVVVVVVVEEEEVLMCNHAYHCRCVCIDRVDCCMGHD
jgi:hypothetical protein